MRTIFQSYLFLACLLSVGLAISSSSQIPNQRLQTGKLRLDSVVAAKDLKEVYEYNERGLQTKLVSCIWDYTHSVWQKSSMTEMTYDRLGRRISDSHYFWTDNRIYPSYKTENSYDTNSYLISAIVSYWNPDSNNWAPGDKINFTLLHNGKTSSQNTLYWRGDQWINGSKIDYTYDSTGDKLLRELHSQWDSTNTWRISGKNEHSFDDKGNELSVISYEYLKKDSTWKPIQKTESKYNAEYRAVRREGSSWKNGQWQPDHTEDLAYDEEGNMQQRTTSDKNGDTWEYPTTLFFVYNYDIPSSNLILPESYAGFSSHQVLYFEQHKTPEPQWSGQFTFYYSEEIVTDLEASHTSPCFSIYPNPNKGTFVIENSIEAKECSLYTLNGNLVKRFAFGAGEKHTENDVPKGVYFVHLNGQVRKLVVE